MHCNLERIYALPRGTEYEDESAGPNSRRKSQQASERDADFSITSFAFSSCNTLREQTSRGEDDCEGRFSGD